LEGAGRVGFSWQGVLLAKDHDPGNPGEHSRHDLLGILMRLVGTDSQGEALAVQFLKHLPDSRIKLRAFQRAFRISGKKVPMNILHQFPGRLAPDATSYEHSATVSYERLYPAGGMGGESMIV